MYDVDGFDASASLITAMHNKGIKAVCYIDAGTWENWRSDAGKFPSYVKGKSNGWPGEKWLDIRQIILRKNLDCHKLLCTIVKAIITT